MVVKHTWVSFQHYCKHLANNTQALSSQDSMFFEPNNFQQHDFPTTSTRNPTTQYRLYKYELHLELPVVKPIETLLASMPQ